MLFSEKWMDLEIIVLSEVSQRQISYEITCMWNLKLKKKNDPNELTYRTETDSDTENKLKVTKKDRGQILGCWN